MAVNYVRALMWPVIFWAVVDTYFFLISFIKVGESTVMERDVLTSIFAATPALLVVSAVVGIRAGRAVMLEGGQWFDPFIAGAGVGLVCGGLGYLYFAFFHPAEMLTSDLVLPGALMDFSLNLGGALLGGWWTMSMRPERGGK